VKTFKDGLYVVEHGTLTAAFVVRQGEVTTCAPVLRKNFDFFAAKAVWYPTDLHLGPLKSEVSEVEKSEVSAS
jgi:hypothetical protein